MRHKLKDYVTPLWDLATAVCGWCLLAPLTIFLRRNPDLVVFLGRDGGTYADNCKHLFAAFREQRSGNAKSIFFAKDRELCRQLCSLGADAVVAHSLRAWHIWLTAGTIIVDNIGWHRAGRYPAARGARLIQLWHGVPLKHVQLTLFEERIRNMPRLVAYGLQIQRRITGRFAQTDLFLSTSPYVTDQAFASAFNYRQVSHAGYPRNDILYQSGNALAEFGVDMEAKQRVEQHRDQKQGLVGLYAPTFRSTFIDPFSAGYVNLEALSKSACAHHMLLLVKLHPWQSNLHANRRVPGIHFVRSDSDVYPLMRVTDFLVTDYSSIYFDYLLLDRPIVFFPYDLEEYLASERPMYFDYDAMTPGPKVRSTSALTAAIDEIARGEDTWKYRRTQTRDLVFSHRNPGSSERLLQELFPFHDSARDKGSRQDLTRADT